MISSSRIRVSKSESTALQTHTAFHEAEIVPFNLYALNPQSPQGASLLNRQPGLGLPNVPSSSSSSSSFPQMSYPGTDPANDYLSSSQPSHSKHSLVPQSEAVHVVVQHANDGGVRIAGGPDEAPQTILELPPMYSSYNPTAP